MPIADFSLKNRLAVVSGASRGIGEAIDAPASTIDKTLDVNLKDFHVMMQLAARLMKKRGGGSIINSASDASSYATGAVLVLDGGISI